MHVGHAVKEVQKAEQKVVDILGLRNVNKLKYDGTSVFSSAIFSVYRTHDELA